MRKAFRITGIVIGIILLFIAGAAIYVKSFLPDVGPALDLKLVSTPEKIVRGEYLAHYVAVCMDCHSTRDWTIFSAPPIPGTLGKGGDVFDKSMGFPGTIYAANITPAGIGDWTDGEIFRAITTGVRKNGKPIFPVMPHGNYGLLDTEDIEAIICYVRSIPAIEDTVPESVYDFPMNFIINTIPKKPNFSKRPDTSDRKAYGKYLITVAACRDCHTPFEKGQFDTSLFFAGGRTFELPSGIVTTANLTPDTETGIGKWNSQQFIEKFTAYRDSATTNKHVNPMKDYFTIMPWSMYAGMKDSDLAAIYEYLRSLQPIRHSVLKFQPSTAAR